MSFSTVIVDADQAQRQLTATVAESLGVEMRFILGNDARSVLVDLYASGHQKRPDLIIVDAVLEGISGLRFVQAIKISLLSSVPVIVTTEYQLDSRTRARFQRAGVTAFLVKPITADALRAAIQAVIPGFMET